MTPVCCNCGMAMKCTKTGARLFECKVGMKPEMSELDRLANIRTVWAADIFICPLCRIEVAAQFGTEPFAKESRPEDIKKAYDAYPEKIFFVG